MPQSTKRQSAPSKRSSATSRTYRQAGGNKSQRASKKRPASTQKQAPAAPDLRFRERRFWRWFRALPLVSLLLCAVIAVVFAALPANLARNAVAPVRYAETINAAAKRHGVDPYLVCAVIKCESGWSPEAQSHVGAQGLMQLMPTTAQELVTLGLVDGTQYPVDELLDPVNNIEYGTAYLAYLSERFESQDEIIAAYNAGLGQVRKWQAAAQADGRPFAEHISFGETFAYVSNVNVAYHEYVRYYPEGIH